MFWSMGAGSIFGSADSGTAGVAVGVPGDADAGGELAAGAAGCGWDGSLLLQAPHKTAVMTAAASKR
jgi:hypothetical protein